MSDTGNQETDTHSAVFDNWREFLAGEDERRKRIRVMGEPEYYSNGVPVDSAFAPHTVNCIRKSAGPRPQGCTCGGDEVLEELKKKIKE